MRIAGFDCATKDFGICYIDTQLYDDFAIQLNTLLDNTLSSIDYIANNTSKQCLDIESLYNSIKNMHEVVSGFLKPVYFNVFDLVSGQKNKEINLVQRTKALKTLLYALDNAMGVPDVVLIEYQMKHNDISRCISHQIMFHYMSYGTEIQLKRRKMKKTQVITYGFGCHPLNNIVGASVVPDIQMVGTTLKNSFSFHKDGDYRNFISKYANYTANKKHTDWNFKYWQKITGGVIPKGKNKTNDIADAFMMIIGWCLKDI